MKKIFLLSIIILCQKIIFAQRTTATCQCDASNNITVTGSIKIKGEIAYKNNFKRYKYKTNITFTNNSNCTIEVIAASIAGKTMYVAKRIKTEGNKTALWQKDMVSDKPFGTTNAAMVLTYRLNTIGCTKTFNIPLQ